MLITICLIMVVGYAVFHALMHAGLNPLNIPGLVVGAIRGALKAVSHFFVGLSLWVVLFIIIKVIAWGLLILSIDILTPPYGIDIETLFAIPLATYMKSTYELSLGWAIGIAYLIIFSLALAYLALWWFVLRKRI